MPRSATPPHSKTTLPKMTPVSVDGTRFVMHKGELTTKPGAVRLTVHAPVETEDLDVSAARDLAEQVRGVVAGAVVDSGGGSSSSSSRAASAAAAVPLAPLLLAALDGAAARGESNANDDAAAAVPVIDNVWNFGLFV